MTHSRSAACAVAIGLVALGVGPVLSIRAQSFSPTSVTFLVNGNALFVEADVDPDLGGVELEARLLDSLGVFKAEALTRSSPQGSAELRFETQGAGRSRPIHVAPGDTALIRIAGREPSSWLVSELSATPDVNARTVSGTAPPSTTVIVTAIDSSGRASARASADALGLWIADFSGEDVAFGPGTHGQAYYQTGTSVTQASWAVRGVELRMGSPSAQIFAESGAEVALQLVEPIEALTATTTWGGYAVAESANALDGESVWLSDAAGEGASLPAAGTASVVIGGGREDLELPEISLAPNPASEVITGTARPGTEIEVTAGAGSVGAVAGADGAWSVDFAGVVDITHETEATATATFTSSSGLIWRVSRSARVPRVLGADPVFAAVDVQGQAGEEVRVAVLFTGQGLGRVDTGTIGPDGTARIPVVEDGETVRMDRVDAVEVSLAGHSLSFGVWHPSVRTSASDDTVEGSAPPLSRVEVRAGEAVRITVTGEDGRWGTDFAGSADLVPGSLVSVQVSGGRVEPFTPQATITTSVTFPVFRVNAQVGTERIRVEGPPGLLAEFELERDGGVIADGWCQPSNGECSAHLVDDSGVALRLVHGDTLLAFVDGNTDVLDVVRVSAHIDPSGRDVVGLAPPDATLFVDFANPRGGPAPPSATTWSDSAGVFDHELPAIQWPLLGPGVVSDVYFTLPGGHRVFSRGVLERAEVFAAERLVSGLAEPAALITVTVLGATWHAATYGRASSLGDYFFKWPPGYLIAGRTVRVEHNRGAHEIQIQSLAAWALPPGDHAGLFTGRDLTVTGGTPASLPVDLLYGRAAPDSPVILSTESSHGGGLHADGPATSRSSIRRAEVRAWLPGAFELVAPVDLDRTNSAVLLPAVRSNP